MGILSLSAQVETLRLREAKQLTQAHAAAKGGPGTQGDSLQLPVSAQQTALLLMPSNSAPARMNVQSGPGLAETARLCPVGIRWAGVFWRLLPSCRGVGTGCLLRL